MIRYFCNACGEEIPAPLPDFGKELTSIAEAEQWCYCDNCEFQEPRERLAEPKRPAEPKPPETPGQPTFQGKNRIKDPSRRLWLWKNPLC